MNSALEYAAARHVTVVAASGDEGVIGFGSSTPVKEVILPASDPLVLGVGGTSLTANPGHRRVHQRDRLEQPGQPAASPARRVAGSATCSPGPPTRTACPASAPPGACRTSPRTPRAPPAWRSRSARQAASYELIGAGGTSAAAPFWAGLIALADQEAGHPLGFVNPAIYRIARGPLYHQAFHDITTGSNTVVLTSTSPPVTITGYQAGPGWDPVTGWGTPDAQVLIPLLAR